MNSSQLARLYLYNKQFLNSCILLETIQNYGLLQTDPVGFLAQLMRSLSAYFCHGTLLLGLIHFYLKEDV